MPSQRGLLVPSSHVIVMTCMGGVGLSYCFVGERPLHHDKCPCTLSNYDARARLFMHRLHDLLQDLFISKIRIYEFNLYFLLPFFSQFSRFL